MVNQQAARRSVPFFFSPSLDTVVEPIPELLDEKNPPKYRPIHFGDFYQKRLDGNYADFGEEIQIHHFEIR